MRARELTQSITIGTTLLLGLAASATGCGGTESDLSGARSGTGGGDSNPETDAGGGAAGGETGHPSGGRADDGGSDGGGIASCGTGQTACGSTCCDDVVEECRDTGSKSCQCRRGTPCGVGQVCQPNPVNPSITSCGSGCYIDHAYFAPNEPNASNKCQVCTFSNALAWSVAEGGTACGIGKVCNGASCQDGCFIGGTHYAYDAPNPANKCQICTSADTHAWSTAPNGTACDTGKTCNGAVCQPPSCGVSETECGSACCAKATHQCATVSGVKSCVALEACAKGQSPCGTTCCVDATHTCLDKGAAGFECVSKTASCATGHTACGTSCCDNSAEECRTTGALVCQCKRGTPCGMGQVCQPNPVSSSITTCATGCYINGAYYAHNATNATNLCQVCTSANTTGWSSGTNGSQCDVGKVCSGSTCQSGCFIGGAHYAHNAINPADKCQVCTSASTTAWQVAPAGTSCESGKICSETGACSEGCYVSGAYYPKDAPCGGGTHCDGTTCVNSPKISAGESHTCGISTSGSAYCWGYNYYGQLGIGNTLSNSPSMLSFPTKAIEISAGYLHTCAIDDTGYVWCWGYNNYGQLGIGTNQSRSTAQQVMVSAGVQLAASAIAAGREHTCAITTGGEVACWGRNNNGQLGNDTNIDSASPVVLSGITATAITAGQFHTCIITTTGEVSCWGYNSSGQLGNSSHSSSKYPVLVVGITASAISAGDGHTCAIISGDQVSCWGRNDYGQLGNGNTYSGNVPATLYGLTASAIAAGGLHTCAVTSSGQLRCWGANGNGQFGINTNQASTTPASVTAITSQILGISAGGAHTCATFATTAICWGRNGDGQLGIGATGGNVLMPTQFVSSFP